MTSPPVLERSIKDFPRKYRRNFGTDAVQLDQPAHLLGADITRWFAPFDQPVAFCFDLSHLLSDHLEPLPFALDLDFQPRRNRPTIAGPHLLKTLTPFCIRNPERPDSMNRLPAANATSSALQPRRSN